LNARAIFRVAGLLLALQGTAAIACGHCVEDKIAAVYDYAIVTQALGQKHQVAFFAIEGVLTPGNDVRQIIKAVESASVADKDSARVSVESASLSVAFDPRHVPFATLQKALERKLAAQKLSLHPLRVMSRAAKIKAMTSSNQ
jgi:hypothetical protein